jgi:hypothetical protein
MRPACAIASWRKPFAAIASRYGESRKSIVFPAESTALYRYVHRPATRMYVSPTAMNGSDPHFGPNPLVQHRSVPEHPPRDGRVINHDAAFGHQFLQVPIAQRVSQLPSHTQDDDLVSEMTSTEQFRSALAHSLHRKRTTNPSQRWVLSQRAGVSCIRTWSCGSYLARHRAGNPLQAL